VPLDTEAGDLDRLTRGDARLAPRDQDLIGDGLHALEVRQQETSARTGADKDAIDGRVEILFATGLGSGQDIDGDAQIVEFRNVDRWEAGIHRCGLDRIGHDLVGDRRLGREERADASTQCPGLLDRHEHGGPFTHLRWQIGRWREHGPLPDVGADGRDGELNVRVRRSIRPRVLRFVSHGAKDTPCVAPVNSGRGGRDVDRL